MLLLRWTPKSLSFTYPQTLNQTLNVYPNLLFEFLPLQRRSLSPGKFRANLSHVISAQPPLHQQTSPLVFVGQTNNYSTPVTATPTPNSYTMTSPLPPISAPTGTAAMPSTMHTPIALPSTMYSPFSETTAPPSKVYTPPGTVGRLQQCILLLATALLLLTLGLVCHLTQIPFMLNSSRETFVSARVAIPHSDLVELFLVHPTI